MYILSMSQGLLVCSLRWKIDCSAQTIGNSPIDNKIAPTNDHSFTLSQYFITSTFLIFCQENDWLFYSIDYKDWVQDINCISQIQLSQVQFRAHGQTNGTNWNLKIEGSLLAKIVIPSIGGQFISEEPGILSIVVFNFSLTQNWFTLILFNFTALYPSTQFPTNTIFTLDSYNIQIEKLITPMTSLVNQLKALKISQPAVKLQPNQTPSSLLFSDSVARTVDVDLVYSMALSGLSTLQNHLPQPILAQELLEESKKHFTRNHLTQQQNQQLSSKLKRLLLMLSPHFLSEDCQKIMEYLMRNYSVHVFQAESLALMFLQYFNTPIYKKLLKNINLDTRNLSFLNSVLTKKGEKINQDFVVLALSQNNYLLETVRGYVMEFIKLEQYSSGDTEISIEETDSWKVSPLSFMFSVYSGLLHRSFNKYLPSACQFCLDVLRQDHEQATNMAMLLATHASLQSKLHATFVVTLVRTLAKKYHRLSKESHDNLSACITFFWQRYPHLFTNETVHMLLETPFTFSQAESYGLAGIYICLFKAQLAGEDCMSHLIKFALQVKEDTLLQNNPRLEFGFYQTLFSCYEETLSSLQSHNKTQIQSLLVRFFEFELAEYYNSNPKKTNAARLTQLFGNRQVSHQGIVSLKNIIRARMTPLKPTTRMQVEEPHPGESEAEDQEQDQSAEKRGKHYKLIAILQKIDPNITNLQATERSRQPMIDLVGEYYSQSSPKVISQAQKNTLVQKLYGQGYTPGMMRVDLSKHDWTLPLLYLAPRADLQLLGYCINQVIYTPALLEDILYKNLLRNALSRMAVLSAENGNYGKVLSVLNRFAEALVKVPQNKKNTSQDQLDSHAVNICLDIILFVSTELINHNGLKKGKLFRLILAHVKLMAQMLTNASLKYISQLRSTFAKVLSVFGPENLYIFYLGFSHQMSKSQFGANAINSFKKILISLFLEGAGQDLQIFINSCVKSLSLCKHLVNDIENNKSTQKQNHQFSVPKKVLLSLFGLINPKEKKKLLRFNMFILRYLFLSQEFTSKLETLLKKLSSAERELIIRCFSNLYSMILSIETKDPKCSKWLSALMTDITTLFPLGLLVQLIEPLLPDPKLYQLLSEKLAKHPKFKSKVLDRIVLIKPPKIEQQWVDLVQTSLDRGVALNHEFVDWVFQALKQQPETKELALILFSHVSKAHHYILIPRLRELVDLLLESMSRSQQFSLAAAYTLIEHLGGLLDPYLTQIFSMSLKISSNLVNAFFENFVRVIDTSTLVALAKTNVRNMHRTADLHNFCVFLVHLSKKGTGEELVKPLYIVLESVSVLLLEAENQQQHSKLVQIQDLQCEVFKNISLKLNEIQLRKVINNLSSWSSKEIEKIRTYLGFNVKKLITTKICLRLASVLGKLFIPFFGYIFESVVQDIEALHPHLVRVKNPNPKKRSAQPSQNDAYLTAEYLKSSCGLLTLLFQIDKDEEFIDSVRFEQLTDPLANLFECVNIHSYNEFVEKSLIPCCVELCNVVKDDYKLKTFNYNVLMRLRTDQDTVHLSVFQFVEAQIESIGDRYLVIINDLVPFVAEHIDSLNPQVQKLVKKVVRKLEEISGEDIKEYLRPT